MMTSQSLHCFAVSSIWAFKNSLDISLAYPPAPSPDSLISTSRNSAPRDLTCSLQAVLVSNARTIAPIFFAFTIAESPATPAPITKTLAGGIFPAAVICPAKNLPKLLAASITALYPEMFAIEDKAS